MKKVNINKLFHWLYGFLMLLPIFVTLFSFSINVANSVRFEVDFNIIDTLVSEVTNVWNNALFSWSKTSFLVEPFNYICDLFGFSDNAIIYYISYWLSISIIWLVFDIIMYVPNLAHRWLDKGSLS